MQQCKHHDVCDLEVDISLPPGDKCILHSEHTEKSKEAFDRALETHRSNQEKGCDFSYMVFPERTDFSQFKFNPRGYVKFLSAKFLGPAVFAFAKFSRGSADFSSAHFADWVTFELAEFEHAANFNFTRFDKQSRFQGVKFLGGSFFTHAQFEGETTFEACRFTQYVNFEDAVFSGRATFSLIEGHVNSVGPVFSEAKLVAFRNVIVTSPGEIIFREVDLRRCLLLNTDVRKVQFSNVIWPQINDLFDLSNSFRGYQKRLPRLVALAPRYLRLLLWEVQRRYPQAGRRFCTYDELSQMKRDGSPNSYPRMRPWPQIERLYRQLKQNYEDQRDFQRANDFH